jgi:hypothetical protein
MEQNLRRFIKKFYLEKERERGKSRYKGGREQKIKI